MYASAAHNGYSPRATQYDKIFVNRKGYTYPGTNPAAAMEDWLKGLSGDTADLSGKRRAEEPQKKMSLFKKIVLGVFGLWLAPKIIRRVRAAIFGKD